MNNIIVNKEICIGCKICFKACFVDVIKWDNEARKPIIAYPEDCAQCVVCEVNCPRRAIKVVPDYKAFVFPRDNVYDM